MEQSFSYYTGYNGVNDKAPQVSICNIEVPHALQTSIICTLISLLPAWQLSKTLGIPLLVVLI